MANQNILPLFSFMNSTLVRTLAAAESTWRDCSVLVIVLFWLGFIAAVHIARRHIRKQATAKQFDDFSVEHKCAQPASCAIRYGFFASCWNKINLILHRRGDLLGETFDRKFRNHGDTYVLCDGYGLPKVVHTIDPDNVHSVLASKSQDYGVPDARLSAIGPIGSKGVVMTEGKLWLKNRKLINVGFRGARSVLDIEENVQTLLSTIAPSQDSSDWTKPLPLFDAFAFMSLDRSIRHMFGVESNLQAQSGEPMKERLRWKEAFDVVASYVGVRSLLGRRSWVYDAPAFRRACGLLRRLCESTIRAAIADSKRGVRRSASFVGNLVQESSDVTQIADITLDIFIAGHNMTAGVLAWLFFELEKAPDVYDTVRSEVLETFGTEAQPKAEMTWDSLQKCQKLHNCIYETMRMYPTLPNIGRQAIENTTLPTGGGADGKEPIAVAKGTVVMCCLYLMHRRPEEWGDDARRFKPDRWIGRTPGYEYAPFGGGPRICPGKLYGLVELFYVTARLMQSFRAIQKPDDGVTVKSTGAGVLLPPHGATLQLQVAN